MRSGKILHQFEAKDGKKVVLRTPKWEDLDDLVVLINSLVEMGADIVMDHKTTREEEADWLAGKLAILEKNQGIDIVAEVGGKVVANCFLEKKEGISSHAGEIGIIVRNDFQNIGIGTEMLETMTKQAKRIGLEMLYLGVFSTNKKAYHVYQKAGFEETGRRPRIFYRNGKYIDDILMVKEIA